MGKALQVTKKERATVMERDGRHCVVCPRTDALEIQHRQSRGMGGTRLVVPVTGLLVACSTHNTAFEGSLQSTALLNGWKVRKWIKDPSLVPVFYEYEGWHVLTDDGRREPITAARAEEMMMRAYGAAYAKGGVL